MLLGQELKFKNKLCNLKLGTFFSALTGNVHIFGLLGDNYTTVTACYWKNNQERGYKTAPESTKVDGTYVTWENAVDAMNRALQNVGSEWRYELKGALPTLRKQ